MAVTLISWQAKTTFHDTNGVCADTNAAFLDANATSPDTNLTFIDPATAIAQTYDGGLDIAAPAARFTPPAPALRLLPVRL